jgi:hypothetical protein
MKGRLAVAGAAALALAASHVLDGAVGILVGLAGLAAAGTGLALTMRKPGRQAGPLLSAAGLLALALWPSGLGGQGAFWAWGLGLACAAGLLACAPAGAVPHDRVAPGAWLRRNALPVAAILLVLAAFVLGPQAARLASDPAYNAGYEWSGPYGPLLAGLPLLAAAGALLLAARALRRPVSDEAGATAGATEGSTPEAKA